MTLVVECYPGVDEPAVHGALEQLLTPALSLAARDALLPPDQIDALVAPFLRSDDPVFRYIAPLTLPQFFDDGKRRLLGA